MIRHLLKMFSRKDPLEPPIFADEELVAMPADTFHDDFGPDIYCPSYQLARVQVRRAHNEFRDLWLPRLSEAALARIIAMLWKDDNSLRAPLDTSQFCGDSRISGCLGCWAALHHPKLKTNSARCRSWYESIEELDERYYREVWTLYYHVALHPALYDNFLRRIRTLLVKEESDRYYAAVEADDDDADSAPATIAAPPSASRFTPVS